MEETLKLLAQWPILQLALAILIAAGGATVILRGLRDKGKETGGQEVSYTNQLLRETRDSLRRLEDETRRQTTVLESLDRTFRDTFMGGLPARKR